MFKERKNKGSLEKNELRIHLKNLENMNKRINTKKTDSKVTNRIAKINGKKRLERHCHQSIKRQMVNWKNIWNSCHSGLIGNKQMQIKTKS